MAILPIVTYDDDVLRATCVAIPENSDEIQTLIDDMFETMYNANGVGLAAPQIGKSLRLFLADADVMIEDDSSEEKYGPMAFINPEIKEKKGPTVEYEEGCLSLPGLSETIKRPDEITISYLDRDFNPQEKTFSGMISRVIQHEFDHIEGVLFFDHLGSFRKRLLKGKLTDIKDGVVEAAYPLLPKE